MKVKFYLIRLIEKLELKVFCTFHSTGNIKYNDHCRVCHKVGDLLCCETCPAVYHLHCLDPPLEHVPNEDWQCPICTAQLCKGVTDCISDVERSGFLCRQVIILKDLSNVVKSSKRSSILFVGLLRFRQARPKVLVHCPANLCRRDW